MSSKSSKSKFKGKKTHSDNIFKTLSLSPLFTIPTILIEKTASEKTNVRSSEKTLGKRSLSLSEQVVGSS